ncbi:MAG: succinate dehydrogenase membrane anchor subunit [Paracoccaceae bacterium]|nr:MAG: succinate dehydrogenase, hydrophobic membrane anchor protein [Alphaproteobacteria bacterium]GIX13687.1 MAG: succinate dehydrogenase membrane anchor subunit [Paracoccaceae bacterium]
MSFRTDRARVAGLGVARDGVGHWWAQRVTAVALVPLAVLFVIPFARALGAGREAVLATYAHPFNAIVAMLFIGTAFYHLKLGLQVIIEDYVHAKAPRAAALVANALGAWLFGLTGVFAVARIAIGQ